MASKGVVGYKFAPETCLAESMKKRQHSHMDKVNKSFHKQLWSHLTQLDQADLLSTGGPIAGNFLDASPVPGDLFVMPDEHIRCTLRRRLRLPAPGFLRGVHGGSSSTHCKHKSHASGELCGCELDLFGRHAGQCHVGGLVDRWHDIIRDWLLAWVGERTVTPVSREPYVSQWDWWETNPETGVRELVQARLDGAFHYLKGGLGYFDVTIVNAATTNAQELAARAHKEGAAAQGAVQGKRRKYAPDKHPAATLVPFAVEALGRPSEEALQFLRDLAPSDPSERAVVLKVAHYRLSTFIAMRQAELLMAAEGASVYDGAPQKSQPGGLPGQLAQLSLSQRRAARADEDEDYVDETRGWVIQLGEGPPGWAERALAKIQ